VVKQQQWKRFLTIGVLITTGGITKSEEWKSLQKLGFCVEVKYAI